MSGISGVGGSVVNHRIQSGSDRFQFYHTREDCAITNFSINQKGRPLACLQLLPFHCALTYPFFDFRRTRPLRQFGFIQAGRAGSHFRCHFDITNSL
jgi:hypothetical protein